MRTFAVNTMTIFSVLLLLLLAIIFAVSIVSDAAKVQATPRYQDVSITLEIPGQGMIVGNYDQTLWTNQSFMQFRGIPYAESPSGKLRFKPPVARFPWRQIIATTDFGKRCPVITTVSELKDESLSEDLEDCLNLCVYTKNLTAQQPVMFYIHGGGFYNGTATDHPPKYLLEQDIVLVVPQYRIGALGWLTTYTDQLPGNAPIGDILLALEWVQQHINTFGGDPKQVTIVGQSAGGGVASLLMLSPKTPENSFQRAIVQSGTIFADWAIRKKPRAQAQRVCRLLGCAQCDNEKNLEQCLLQVSVKELLEVTVGEMFSPVVGDLQGILPQIPNELLKQYKREIPLMTGFTKHDGSFVLASYYDALKLSVGNLSQISVRKFSQGLLNMVNDTSGLTDQLVRRLLFTPRLLAGNDHKAALPSYFDLTSDIFIKSSVISLAANIFGRQRAPVYAYSFEYEGEQTRFGYEFGNKHYPFNGGVHHSNDNIYIFSTHTLNTRDTVMAKKMVALWTSFAISGKPNIDNELILPAMSSEAGPYFRINEQFRVALDLLQQLTITLDDPDNAKLDRPDIDF